MAKITEITLEKSDGGKDILSLDEAKELYDQLRELFGDKTKYIPSQRVVIDSDKWRPPNPYGDISGWPYDIWCSKPHMG